MEIYEALSLRQTFPKMRQDDLPRELLEKLLLAAVQAPNHHRNRPWRFIVISGTARNRLGEIAAQSLARRNPSIDGVILDSERKKPLRAPVIIAVGIDQPDQSKLSEIENICAGAAAVENLLLAAQAEGIASVWRTGAAVLDSDVKAFCGLQAEQHLIAMVYLGYPEGEFLLPTRPDHSDRTVWMNS